MKRLFVVTLLVMLVMVMSACTRTQVTAPEKAAVVNTGGSLAKESADDPTYGPTSSRFSFPCFSTTWPPSAPNVVIWYFGAKELDFLPGFVVLDGDLDSWTTQPFSISITLRKRGADAANVSPQLSVIDNGNSRLLVRFTPTTSFTTVTAGPFPAGTRQLKLLFHNTGDLFLAGRHADVNIDISSVTIF